MYKVEYSKQADKTLKKWKKSNPVLFKKDKEDAFQYYSAIASKVDFIVTRNIKDFAQSQIKVIPPSDIMQII